MAIAQCIGDYIGCFEFVDYNTLKLSKYYRVGGENSLLVTSGTWNVRLPLDTVVGKNSYRGFNGGIPVFPEDCVGIHCMDVLMKRVRYGGTESFLVEYAALGVERRYAYLEGYAEWLPENWWFAFFQHDKGCIALRLYIGSSCELYVWLFKDHYEIGVLSLNMAKLPYVTLRDVMFKQ